MDTPQADLAPVPQRQHPAHLAPLRPHNRPTVLFVTVCTARRWPGLANAAVQAALLAAWAEASSWTVGYYLIMPDHMHLFCAPHAWPPARIAVWCGVWKRGVSRRTPGLAGRWLRDCWDTQMRDQRHYRAKLEYVRQNPVRRGLAATAGTWAYQGTMHPLPWWAD